MRPSTHGDRCRSAVARFHFEKKRAVAQALPHFQFYLACPIRSEKAAWQSRCQRIGALAHDFGQFIKRKSVQMMRPLTGAPPVIDRRQHLSPENFGLENIGAEQTTSE